MVLKYFFEPIRSAVLFLPASKNFTINKTLEGTLKG